MKLVKEKISIKSLREMAEGRFGNFIKAVVDVDRGIVVVDAELHADEEAKLLESGSKQKHLWGINLYPEFEDDDWIEFDSMINLRPSQGNKSREVEDPKIRERVKVIVNKLVQR